MGASRWEPGEGPRDRLLARGPQSLSDAEVLAVLLQTGSRQYNAVQLAGELLSQFGGLVGVMRTDASRLLAFAGVGRAKYAVLQAALELARRQALQELEAESVLSSPGQTRRFLQHHLGSQVREVFSVIFMDNQHRVIRCEDLFLGTIDGAAVYPREVAVRALQYRAAAVILAHNHPSGVAEPSSADRRITERLCSALALLDIRVLDHIIVGRGREFSFAEEGLL
ncbi:JAB domain-containing protein [Pseudohalioglobus sediminis]|uniref:JAB domain-containing protein n=1 Tax=Pseudohalioglobus sediminis TaxID=2606449 RepID=A0A5B0WX33_9GAMM|nr:DNA repair protein RadC [Pseudohalioglobus sediminis]KAA1190449.1 JAB domain-containing protein [Pseudohalioglobus sediminis]